MGFDPGWLPIIEAAGLIAPIDPPPPAIDCSEREFQSAVVALAKCRGWKTYHTFDSRRSAEGWFDLVCARVGRVLFAELKRESGKQTDEQLAWFTMFVSAGKEVYCWRPSDWRQICEVLR